MKELEVACSEQTPDPTDVVQMILLHALGLLKVIQAGPGLGTSWTGDQLITGLT